MASRLSSSATSLEIELMEIGKKLVHRPSSTREIIKSLVQTERVLSRRIRVLSKSIVQPLHVICKALISEDLLRHANMVVKIYIACCICEIIKIMAPHTPYNDNQMKEFFELVVTVFEKVAPSSGDYTKVIKLIKKLSSGEVVVVMCHLQLDRLSERLFRCFLKAADSKNSPDVVSKMAKIMTMIIKESKELPRELVNLLATPGKSKNKLASPIRKLLAKKVLDYFADQLNTDYPDMTVSETKTLAIVKEPMPSKSAVISGKRKKQIQSVEHGKDLVGSRIKVWWPEDKTFYQGTVKDFESDSKKHKVHYDDGDKETLDLKKEKWQLVEDVSAICEVSPIALAIKASSTEALPKKVSCSQTPPKDGSTQAPPEKVSSTHLPPEKVSSTQTRPRMSVPRMSTQGWCKMVGSTLAPRRKV